MSGPQPPLSSDVLGKNFVQYGGPVSVGSGATTVAVTFSTPFPDANYQTVLEWVSGSGLGYGAQGKTLNNFIAQFSATATASAFRWMAWRLTT